MKELSGKRILVTGAAKGIGAGIAEVFAENGADLLLHYRSSPEEAENLKQRLSGKGGTIRLCRADLGTEEGLQSLFAEVNRVFGGLDAAVNNAGWDPGFMPLENVTFERYAKLTDMNIRGTLFCCLNEIRLMRNNPSGGQYREHRFGTDGNNRYGPDTLCDEQRRDPLSDRSVGIGMRKRPDPSQHDCAGLY